MPDMEKVIKGLQEAYELIMSRIPERYMGYAPYACLNATQMLREQEPTGWVSVHERLPEREGLYLCWSAINGAEAIYQIHLWKDGRWYWVHDVRYWMPLPEPPEEVQNGQ